MSRPDAPASPETPGPEIPGATPILQGGGRDSDRPDRIGPYKILDVLGEGGMGVVYLAEQAEPVRRRVALKIIRLGMDSKQVIARFESERQALAVMDHPNIAKIYDGGVTDTGRPYFVMELVQGTPITAYADTHKLTVDERLRLFIDVCHAVQHAHQKGVIHRDLKPSNVLVSQRDNRPIVKVIDFGIAKAMGQELTERTLVTRVGQMIGTPEYMSPEQAEMSGLDVDTRTDVYSLGVILYELVVGTLPFDFAGAPGMSLALALRERSLTRPSTRLTGLGPGQSTVAALRRTTPRFLRRELRGDVDWIILKAIETDRTRRYETANGLALELERHLSNQPILARPPSVSYRFGKFVRRHRAAVVAAAIAVVAVLAGASAATVGFVHARASQAVAEREARTAQRVSDFLVSLFQVSDPSEARGNSITAREILDRGASSIDAELAGEPEVQARLMRTIGTVYRQLGLYAAGLPLLRKAVAQDERSGDQRELAISLTRLGQLYRSQGNFSEAEAALLRAVDIGRRRSVSDEETAAAIGSLGAVYMQQGRYGEAEPLLRRAMVIQREVSGAESRAMAAAVGNLGALYYHTRNIPEAERYFRQALAIDEKVLPGNDPAIAGAASNVGVVAYTQGNYAEAERAYSRALSIYEATLGPDHPRVAAASNNLAETYAIDGRYDEAEQYFKRALAIKEKTLSPTDPSLAAPLTGLANIYRDRARYAEAEPLYQRAIRLIEKGQGPSDPDLVDKLGAYAKLLRATGRTDRAAALEKRAATIRDTPKR